MSNQTLNSDLLWYAVRMRKYIVILVTCCRRQATSNPLYGVFPISYLRMRKEEVCTVSLTKRPDKF